MPNISARSSVSFLCPAAHRVRWQSIARSSRLSPHAIPRLLKQQCATILQIRCRPCIAWLQFARRFDRLGKEEKLMQHSAVLLPDGVVAHRDLAYVPGGHPRQALDLYLPRAARPLPLIVWIHGGAFRMGSKEDRIPAEML